MFLVAAEASGDALGADLAGALRARAPGLELAGVGGAQMAAAGVPSRADISGLAILGFIDGLLAYRRVKEAVAATVAAILAFRPRAAVLIDSWGFTLRVAQAVRAAAPDILLVKYIGPQVWATRPGRARTLAAAVDHLICIHDFEVAYYRPFGLACTVCGHPALGRYKPGDAAALRSRLGIQPGEQIVLVLPGSRSAEVRRIGPVLWKAGETLAHARPGVRLMAVAAGSVRDAVQAQAPSHAQVLDERDKEDAFAAAGVALAASGTVTTEVALQGAPLVIGYKLGWITWALARTFFFRSRYATLMNVAADAEAAPEFLQTRCTADNIAAAAAPLLDDPAARALQVQRQNDALARMGRGGPPASEIAADAVLHVMGRAVSSAPR